MQGAEEFGDPDVRELLVIGLRERFGYSCEVRGDDYFAVLLPEDAPEIRIRVTPTRLAALASFTEVSINSHLEERLVGGLNAHVNAQPFEFEVINGKVVLSLGLPVEVAISEGRHAVPVTVFVAGTQALAEKIRATHVAVHAQSPRSSGVRGDPRRNIRLRSRRVKSLAVVVATLKHGDPMSPVTILAPNNIAGIVARRHLAFGLGNGSTGVAAIEVTTLPRLAERLASHTLAPRRPATARDQRRGLAP